MQRQGGIPRFPIVAATAYSDPASQADCAECGMDQILVKPLSLPALEEVLGLVLTSVSKGH